MAENHPIQKRCVLHYVNMALAWPFVVLIKAYRLVISPLKKYIMGPNAGCRFHPT